MNRPRLDVEMYQIADDAVLKHFRTDGTGWDWCWAGWQRDWMDATPQRYAYRCLPLAIMNQTGWWIRNPVGFTATWRGRPEPGSIDFRFEASQELWAQWINSQFGAGIITWNTPFLFRTRPHGSRLFVCGPVNSFKANVQPMSALIESDWISMSFTMNWKVIVPNQPVRFELAEPLFQAIPLASNICADLEEASVSYQKLSDNPELHRAYLEWDRQRRLFHEGKTSGDVNPDDWQKDYFHGRDAIGREAAPDHMTKLKAPTVRYRTATNPPSVPIPAAASQARAAAPDDRPSDGRFPRPAHRSPHAEHPEAPQFHESLFQTYLATAMIEPALDPAEEPDAPFDQPGVKQVGLAYQSRMGTPASPIDSASMRQVDDEWRRWIAENLMIGQPPESILEVMVSSGFARDDSAREIDLALQSPYFKGSELLRNRLTKRDWVLAALRKSNRLHPDSAEVPRRHRLSREEFLREYYSTNRPVVITGMMDDWPALGKWNLDYFAEELGDRDVEVQMGRTASANYEIEQQKYTRRIRFREFVEKVRTAGETNDLYMTANNDSFNRQSLPELWDDIVQIPEYLASGDAGGFFWMGPAGTITPFHHDLTNNLMAQVIGRKRLKIAPSWDMPLMRNHLHCFSRIDGRGTPPAPRPQLFEPQILEFTLQPGEVLFLPVGCVHYVEGLDIAVTVSFTNFAFDNDYASFYSTYGPV
jgi:hypothetical protein